MTNFGKGNYKEMRNVLEFRAYIDTLIVLWTFKHV